MIQSFEREIKGNKYTITQFAARPNLLFIAKWTKQLKSIAPLLKTLSDKGINGVLDADVSNLDFAGMLESFCESLSPQAFSDLIFESFKNVSVISEDEAGELKAVNLANGNNFDMYFAGKMGHLFIVLCEVLKINIFGGDNDFFTDAITKAKAVIDKKEIKKAK